VYNIKQAKRDIDAVYSMGLFDDVNILPSPSEDSNLENPKAISLCCASIDLPTFKRLPSLSRVHKPPVTYLMTPSGR
jgi:hypothetical protein